MTKELNKLNRRLLTTVLAIAIAATSTFAQEIKNVVLVHGA